MWQLFKLQTDAIVPSVAAVLRAQGVPSEAAGGERAGLLAQDAIARFKELAKPVGVMMSIDTERFASVYAGEGENDSDTPLARIFPRSGKLALFAVTVGERTCTEISNLFNDNEPARAAALDAAASEATELAVQVVADLFCESVRQGDNPVSLLAVMPFSPGYCGWHITGQKELFDYLRPEDTGISLNESCLMQPLKSISGVLVAGERRIFDFEDDFEFCDDCVTRSCRDRIKRVQQQQVGQD